MSQTSNVSRLVFTPSEATTYTTELVDKLRRGIIKGIPFFVKEIDEKMTPWQPQYLITCNARPGHGKTSIASWHFGKYADYLQTIGPSNNTVGVYVGLEQSVEQTVLYDMARRTGIPMSSMLRGEVNEMEFEKIRDAGILHSSSPIFYVGTSDRIQGRRPPITVDTIHEALNSIQNWQGVQNAFKIGMVYVDYLQMLPRMKGSESEAVGHGANIEGLKDLARQWSVPVLVTTQAKPKVDEQADPQPGNDCIEWTNGADKAGDSNFSVMRPCKYFSEGELCGDTRVKGNMQMSIQFNKQRMGDAPFRVWLVFDVATCRLLGVMSPKELNA